MGTVVQTEAEIDRFMEVTGQAVHLLLDTGHATWGGGNAARIARHYKGRISHFHAKDVREEIMWQANRNDWSFLDSVLAGVYTVPGDGMVDYLPVLRELAGYSGWAVVEAEQDPKKADPRKYAKLGRDNLQWFLGEADLI
jgi:inosose dehydratase